MNTIHIKYKNILIFILSIIFAIILSRLELFHNFLLNLGSLGYIGAFVAGMLFVSTFTVSTGIILLLILAEKLSPVEIGIIAGMGGVISDFTIFRFIKNNLAYELEELYKHIDQKEHLRHVMHSKYFAWSLPVVGAFIIASPLPDEIGVSLLGISKMNNYKFIIISFLLNAIGIFLVISASLVIKP